MRATDEKGAEGRKPLSSDRRRAQVKPNIFVHRGREQNSDGVQLLTEPLLKMSNFPVTEGKDRAIKIDSDRGNGTAQKKM